jgi:hypothetical protein
MDETSRIRREMWFWNMSQFVCPFKLILGRFLEIPTIWKIPVTPHTVLPRGKRGTRQIGIFFSKLQRSWIFIVMVQELEEDEDARFYYGADKCDSIYVNLSTLIKQVILDFSDMQFLSTLACDIIYGWNEYLAELRSYVAQVVGLCFPLMANVVVFQDVTK